MYGFRASNAGGKMAMPTNGTTADESRFDWNTARTLLAGLPGGGLNIAHEAVDRHVAAGN